MNKFWKMMLGTGLYLLDQSEDFQKTARSARDRASSHLDDLTDAARDKYDIAAERMARASRALRGDDSSSIRNFLLFAAGAGVGAGVALMLAPTSGEEARDAISGKAQEISGKLRNRFSSAEETRRTGTE